jgi:drug/metabolite transporter (DMT)-like permease
MSTEALDAAPKAPTRWLDLTAIVVCTLAWGTTWFAITLQFGVVDPVISIVYRFALAAVLLFGWCALRRTKIAMTGAQHAAAFGIGLFNFAINYTLVYWAEQRVVSAIVAIAFAAMAFVNLIVFRIAFGQRAPAIAWGAAALGILGVCILSWNEIAGAALGGQALAGIAMALTGVVAASLSNVAARRGEIAGANVAALTAWAMAYGAGVLALFALLAGKAWNFAPTLGYVLSLAHLSLVGSVIAFLLYYGLARRRGYSTASYVSALTPPLAMVMSSLFEHRSWQTSALLGLALIVSGQALLLRAKRPS